LDKSV